MFIGLDSSAEKIDEEQWSFYEQVMKKVRPHFKHVVLFTHVPPQVPEGEHAHTLVPEAVEKMAQMLQKYPVDIIITGHVHYFSKQDFHGIPLYTVPPSGQYFAGPVHKFGYLNVTVDKQGIHVENVYSNRKKASEWWDIFFIDLILTNKVRWIAGITLIVGVLMWLSGHKCIRWPWHKKSP